MPGPGNYANDKSEFGKSGQKYTIGGKQGQRFNDNPGPGAYQADPSKTKDTARSFGMGSQKRALMYGNSKDDQSLPGPGCYDLSSEQAKTFTFSGKSKERYNQNPGPGAYDASPERTKDSARTYAIGNEKRTTQFSPSRESE